MDYSQTLEYIHSLGKFGIRPGLDRMNLALKCLGNPERSLQIIHVAGTNGKGSTVAMISSILQAAGLRVGAFTSPHLSDYCERIAIDGASISHESLSQVIDRIRPVIDEVSSGEWGAMTEFEVSTAAALVHFANEKPDICVIEVGMGGRLDSTNVISPLVSVITPVEMDHMDRLGDTLAAIAGEKAGIIKPGCPVVVAGQKPEAAAVIAGRAAELSSPEWCYGRDFIAQNVTAKESGTYCTIKGTKGLYEMVRVNLLGPHQAQNAAVAAAACEVMAEAGGFDIQENHIRSGLDHVTWPGRFEFFPGCPAVVLDGAHNPHGIRALADALRQVFPGQKAVFVMGILDNRPVEEMIGILAPQMKRLYATAADYSGAAAPARIARAAESRGIQAIAVEGASSAVFAAIANAQPDDLLCLCGSLYFIGEIRPELLRRL